MREDEDRNRPHQGGPDNPNDGATALPDKHPFAAGPKRAPGPQAQLWLRWAALSAAGLGLIGLLAASSKWILAERETSRAIDLLAMNSRAAPPRPPTSAIAAGGPAAESEPIATAVKKDAPAPKLTWRVMPAQSPEPSSKREKFNLKHAASGDGARGKARGPALIRPMTKVKSQPAGARRDPGLRAAPRPKARAKRMRAALHRYRVTERKTAQRSKPGASLARTRQDTRRVKPGSCGCAGGKPRACKCIK